MFQFHESIQGNQLEEKLNDVWGRLLENDRIHRRDSTQEMMSKDIIQMQLNLRKIIGNEELQWTTRFLQTFEFDGNSRKQCELERMFASALHTYDFQRKSKGAQALLAKSTSRVRLLHALDAIKKLVGEWEYKCKRRQTKSNYTYNKENTEATFFQQVLAGLLLESQKLKEEEIIIGHGLRSAFSIQSFVEKIAPSVSGSTGMYLSLSDII